MNGDHTCAEACVTVLGQATTKAVVFGVDCLKSSFFADPQIHSSCMTATFADSLSISGADPRLRPVSVDVARYASETKNFACFKEILKILGEQGLLACVCHAAARNTAAQGHQLAGQVRFIP